VAPLGEETRIDGRLWRRVRAPDGAEGWMAGEYLRTAS
jgi:SH3-like domain-containing protein